MKLLHILSWHPSVVDALEQQFPEITFVKASDPRHAAEELADTDILITGGPFYLGDIANAVNTNAPSLKWIQSVSIGTDRFERGGVPDHVKFTNAAGLKGRTVSEHTMALLLGHTHAIPQMERFRAKSEWSRDVMRPQMNCIEDQTLLLLGYGSIGQEIARKAKAFDMNVVAMNTSGTGDGEADTVVPISDLAEWLPKADFIASSLPAIPATEKIISYAEFELMKPTSVLINVGRGTAVDHAALLQALRQKQIAGACLDVFEEEPLPADDPIWQLANVILSPHVGGSGGPGGQRFAELVAENLRNFLNDQPLRNEVKFASV